MCPQFFPMNVPIAMAKAKTINKIAVSRVETRKEINFSPIY